MTRRGWGFAAGVIVTAALTACTPSSSGTTPPHTSSASSTQAASSPASSAPAGSATAATFPPAPGAPAHQFYVSIGDSYAAGYQPTATRQGRTTRNGFAYQVVDLAKAKDYDYTLVNFACAGATTTSVLTRPGCPAALLGPGAASYAPKTQLAAAETFLAAHRGRVGLVTVSIGGNDITRCGLAADPVACLSSALSTVQTNLATLMTRLRRAAGPQTRIVGITYPDVLLGDSLSKDPKLQGTAKLSAFAFQSLINPALKAAYEHAGGRFVDVTAATGAYGPMTASTSVPPYGSIPVPVAKICTLTFYCQFHDIHPRTPGYALIARLVVGTLPHH